VKEDVYASDVLKRVSKTRLKSKHYDFPHPCLAAVLSFPFIPNDLHICISGKEIIRRAHDLLYLPDREAGLKLFLRWSHICHSLWLHITRTLFAEDGLKNQAPKALACELQYY
jgi:hypothetical protein